MSKKPHPTVSVGAKISPELADELYGLAGSEYGGNVSEAVREGIKLIIVTDSLGMSKRWRKLLGERKPMSPESVAGFFRVVDEEFGGDLGEAVRTAVNLLLSRAP